MQCLWSSQLLLLIWLIAIRNCFPRLSSVLSLSPPKKSFHAGDLQVSPKVRNLELSKRFVCDCMKKSDRRCAYMSCSRRAARMGCSLGEDTLIPIRTVPQDPARKWTLPNCKPLLLHLSCARKEKQTSHDRNIDSGLHGLVSFWFSEKPRNAIRKNKT